ncbi:MAG: M1 family aminopeptidase [bacterium]
MPRHRLRASIPALVLALALASAARAAEPAIPAAHWQASVILEPETHELVGRGEVLLSALPAANQPWRFLLHRELRVRSVTMDGKPLTVTEIDGWNPRHFWRHPPYADLGGYEVAREFEVSPPIGGWGTNPPRLSIRWSGTIADSLHAPEKSYDRSFEVTTGRIVPEGAYLSGETFWLPWGGAGLFTFQLSVTTPVEWSAISAGDGEGRDVEGRRATMHWVSRDPVEHAPIVAGPYEIERREHKGVSIETWCYADTPAEVSQPYLDAAVEAIDRFSERYGPYPHSKFALVENYWQTGWGLAGFTLLGDRVIRLPFIIHTSFPHEILHNWWGNGVYVDASTGNWCEGLTTFGADYAAKVAEGGSGARDYRRNSLVGYKDFATQGGRDFALSRFRERDSAATQAVGYGKTLFVFTMLRDKLGPATFDASLKRFYRENVFRRAGWKELRKAFEDESRQDLSRFFTQWVERPGAPTLAIGDTAVDHAGSKWHVRGSVVVTDGDWALDVPVVVRAGEQRQEIVVATTGPRTPFTIDLDAAPTSVSVDPEFRIFRTLYDGEVAPTLSGVLGARATRIVIGSDAAGELRDALLTLGREWAEADGVELIEESAHETLPSYDGGTWFFGPGDAARVWIATLPPTASAAPTRVLAGRLGGPSGPPAAALWTDDASAVASIGRKVPHYSKYSWLEFEGDQNVGKGVWDSGDSPLSMRLKGPRS